MNQFINNLKTHFPAYVALALVVVNALVDSGNLVLPPHVQFLVSAVLAASGLGVLHVRQQKAS